MTITSPSGKRYDWNKDTPPTAQDIASLQRHEPAAPTPPVQPASTQPANASGLADVPIGGTGPSWNQIKGAGMAVADMGAEGVGAGVGQAIGTATGPLAPVAVPVGGAIGGTVGNLVGQLRGLSMGDREKFSVGEMLAAGAAGAVPGGPMYKAGAKVVAREIAKQALANVGAQSVRVGVDEGRMITLGEATGATVGAGLGASAGKLLSHGFVPTEAQVLFEKRQQVFNKMRDHGAVVAPSSLDRGNALLSTVAANPQLIRSAAKQNAIVFNRLANEELGGLGSKPLAARMGDGSLDVEQHFKNLRKTLAEPYETIAGIAEDAQRKLSVIEQSAFNSSDSHGVAARRADPEIKKLTDPLIKQAGADIRGLRTAREDAKKLWEGVKNNDPAAYPLWQSAQVKIESLENRIADAAESIGDKSLVKRLAASRVKIAQSYNVESATNKGNGLIDITDLGQQLERGAPLSGKLKDMALFALNFPGESREASRVASANTNNLSTHFAATNAARGDVGGTIASGYPLIGRPVRSLLLSQFAQDYFKKPLGSVFHPGLLETAAAKAMMAGGRNAFVDATEDPASRK